MITTTKPKPDLKKKNHAQDMIDVCWNMTLFFAFASIVLMADGASAAGSNAISTVFCNINGLFISSTGRAIADVAVVALGVAALMGKLSWGQALTVAVGIGLMFGSGALVVALGGSNTCTSANNASNNIQSIFCDVTELMKGTLGVAVATIAIIAIALAAMVGKVSQGMALIVATGIGLVFGADTIVGTIGGSGTACTAAKNITGGGTTITTVLCSVAASVVGNTGSAIATIGIIGLGVAALMGKVSTGTAITVAAGIGVLFGASSIATTLSGGTACAAGGKVIDISSYLCPIVYLFQGTPGIAIATLAVIAIGVGALLGKVSAGMVIAVAVGVGVVFGATTLTGSVSGVANPCAANNANNNATSLNTALCNIIDFFGGSGTLGSIGVALITLCVLPLGVAALLGKVSPGVALAVAVGIGLMFGANTIITALAPTTGVACAIAPAAVNSMSETLCDINAIFAGGIGSAIASLAVVACGIGAMMGKISWSQALAVMTGIGIVFGATSLTSALDAGATCTTTAAATTYVNAASGIYKPICYIVNWCTGAPGQAIAAIAIIGLGLSALNGKVSWGIAMVLALGLALVFGAASVVTSLGGSVSCTSVAAPPVPTGFTSALCGVITAMTGVTGRAIAAVAIAAVGIMAMNGKLSSGLALLVATGVALIFGATSIVTNLGGGAGGFCSGLTDLSQQQTAVGQAFCNALGVMTGITGKGIAATGVIALGAGALMGKIQHSTAGALAVGVAAVFGASSLVVNLGGENAWTCTPQTINNINNGIGLKTPTR